MKKGWYWCRVRQSDSWHLTAYLDSVGCWWFGDREMSEEGMKNIVVGPLIPEPEHMADLRRAESLIAKGKDLPFKPSFGMLVIEWMRQIQKEGM